MSIFAKELIMEILVRLPVKSLIRFQSVSKPWCALNNDPDFIKKHLQRSIQAPSEFTLLLIDTYKGLRLVKLTKEGQLEESMKVFQSSSMLDYWRNIGEPCNGLFYTSDERKRRFIWNPSIRKHKMIPPVIPPVNLGARAFAKWEVEVGIGYDPVNNDHKVVKIVKFSKLEESIVAKVLVYSLKKNSWRRIECEWPFKDFFSYFTSLNFPGTYLNGSMHFLVEIGTDEGPNNRVLLTFNLTVEKFQVHPFPVESPSRLLLRVLGGNLCAYTTHSGWILKEYGLPSSWSLLYSLPENSPRCEPIVISEDGQEILMVANYRKYSWYNIKKRTWSPLKIQEVLSQRCVVPSWVPSRGSLVLIDGDND